MPTRYPLDCRYRTRGRARPRRPSERVRLLRFLARVLTEEQLERARGVDDVEALRFIAAPWTVQG